MIIDADSHFFEPLDWFEDNFPKLEEKLPPFNVLDMISAAVLPGDLVVEKLPTNLQKNVIELMPTFIQPALRRLTDRHRSLKECKSLLLDAADKEMSAIGFLWRERGAYDVEQRIKFADDHKISYQFLNGSAPGSQALQRAARTGDPKLVRDCMYAWNTWALDTLAPHSDRLWAVIRLDLSDVDTAVVEMTRARKAGSRCFSPGLAPVAGRSPAHPDFERIWAAAADLGMAAVLHIGTGFHSGWQDVPTGWANDGSDHLFNYLTLCKTQNAWGPELFLGSLILNGVLERHPKLPVIVSEFGISWLPYWLDVLDSNSFGLSSTFRPEGMIGLPLKPSEYVARQVFVTPLPEEKVAATARAVPGVLQFATDYPHPEGSADALGIFETQLEGFDRDEKEGFYGRRLAKIMELN